MFPLSTETGLLLAVIALAASTAAYRAVRDSLPAWFVALLLTVGALWAVPVAAVLGLDHYTIRAAFLAGAWTSGALLVGLLWGVFVRRIAVGVPVVLVAFSLPLAASAILLERQRVPQAPCAIAVDFEIGGLALTVPRGFGLRTVETPEVQKQQWEGYYGEELGGKPDVRALCQATDGGANPVEVAHIWLSVSSFRRELQAECENGADSSDMHAVCDALASTQPTIVQFYAHPDDTTLVSLGQFNANSIIQARAEGNPEGSRCNDSTRGPERRHCTIWLQLTPSVFTVSSAWAGPYEVGEDLVTDTDVLLGELVRRLSMD